MTKREAIVAATGAAIGLMAGRAKAEQLSDSGSVFRNLPQAIYFNLDNFSSFTFRHGDRSVTFTSKEIFDTMNREGSR